VHADHVDLAVHLQEGFSYNQFRLRVGSSIVLFGIIPSSPCWQLRPG